jgi:hypothetical protein
LDVIKYQALELLSIFAVFVEETARRASVAMELLLDQTWILAVFAVEMEPLALILAKEETARLASTLNDADGARKIQFASPKMMLMAAPPSFLMEIPVTVRTKDCFLFLFFLFSLQIEIGN